MGPEIAAELDWAEPGEDTLTVEMTRAQRLMEVRIASAPGALLGAEANDIDVSFLELPETREAFRRIIPNRAVHGVAGLRGRHSRVRPPLGFALGSIRVPVLITYGDPDTTCPVVHDRFLAAAVPGATVVETAGGGHFAEDPTHDILSAHRWLRTGQHPGA